MPDIQVQFAKADFAGLKTEKFDFDVKRHPPVLITDKDKVTIKIAYDPADRAQWKILGAIGFISPRIGMGTSGSTPPMGGIPAYLIWDLVPTSGLAKGVYRDSIFFIQYDPDSGTLDKGKLLQVDLELTVP